MKSPPYSAVKASMIAALVVPMLVLGMPNAALADAPRSGAVSSFHNATPTSGLRV